MSKVLKKITAIMLTLAMVVTICPQGKLISIKAADAEDNTPYNLSKGRPAYASSQTGSGSAAELAVDGNTSTSFTSYQGDNQWLTVDLGQAYTVGRIVIDWISDAGKIYDVLVSSDNKTWTTVHRVLKGYANATDSKWSKPKKVKF